jgi:formylglycine-generating enzyme required for sulfatase activity/tRNA A-37 threonylcarbamoyl transferase component Bud32
MTSPLQPGTLFGRDFEIVRPLRVGGMGAVYVVTQRSTGKLRALKVMAPSLAGDPSTRERFVLEARAAARIESEHVVEVLTAGVDEETGAPFIVMELLRGEDLGDVLVRHGSLPLGDVAEVLDQVGHALEQAHAHAIVHRDLKPENIYVAGVKRRQGGYVLKLLDFGVAKLLEAGSLAGSQMLGTPLFMAPEQAEIGGRVGPATDVWALGLLAFRLLTGRDFWVSAGTSLGALLREVCVDPIPAASERAAALGVDPEVLPLDFDAWFARCVCRDAAARFPEAGEAVRAFLRLVPRDAPRGALAAPDLRTPEEAATSSAPTLLMGPATLRDTPRPEALPGATAGGTAETLLAPGLVRARPRGRRALLGPALAAGLVAALGVGVGVLLPGRAPTPAAAPTAAVSARPAVVVGGGTCPPGMVLIPGGKMFMGARDLGPEARPPHAVSISTFCLDRTEVTTRAYAACAATGECERALDHVSWPGLRDADRLARYSPFCNANHPDRGDHPINCVAWSMAAAYCARHAGRLPTEAEWEMAARGPQQHKYPWGDAPPDATRLNACGLGCSAWGERHGEPHDRLYETDDGYPATAPVGAFPAGASAHGILDLAGNVQEWTADWYAPYGGEPVEDPKGPPAGVARVVRGNDFFASARDSARPASRFQADPETYNHAIGFRCAADPR